MSSGLGYPDWQKIQQWLGSPLDQQTGYAIGAGVYDAGPFNLGSWASVVVAIKPAGGPVTVTVTQRINGGPASLADVTTFVVTAGTTIFESVVLFGDVVSIHIAGAVGGTTFDYALFPSNTTTNAQVLANAIINVQHNEALVAAEATLDFADSVSAAWTVADDAANTRVKVGAVPLVPVFTTAAALAAAIPAPGNGQQARIKPATTGGADVILLTYDAGIGRWLSEPIATPSPPATIVTASAAGVVFAGPTPVLAFYDMVNAGFKVQARVFGAGLVGGGGVWKVEVAAFQYASGGTVFSFLQTLASDTGSSAAEGYIDSGWSLPIAPAFTLAGGGLTLIARGDGVNNMTAFPSSLGWIRFVL